MKKLLVAGIVVTAVGVMQAIAADIPKDPLADFPYVPGPEQQPRLPVYQRIPVFSWTGCYLGIHGGFASGDNQFNGQFFDPVIPIGLNATPGAPTGSGAISSNGIDDGTGGVLGGAQAGCDFQFARNWVVGVSADAAGANITGSTAQTESFGLIGPVAPVTTSVNSSGSLNAQTNFITTFTGRFGYSMGGGLFYVKGGGAYEQSKYSFDGNVASTSCNTLIPPTVPPSPARCAIFNPTVNQQFNFGAPANSRFGWTIGVGTEWMIYGGWSVFGEYDYLNFGTRSVAFSDPVMGSYNFSVVQNFNEFKLGINYRFGVEGDPYRQAISSGWPSR